MKKLEGIELLKELCLVIGPTSYEDMVADFISEQLKDHKDMSYRDKMNNLCFKYKGSGEGYDEKSPKSVMLSAHMDEVGMMINDITDDGYIKFSCVGGIDARVLCGRRVTFHNENGYVHGVIASKAIHMQTAEDRKNVTPVDKMYIDIGAKNGDDARKYLSVGDMGTFDSDFVLFGKDGAFMKGKAIDDRLGCAVIIETMRRLYKEKPSLPYDVYGCFTVREEFGYSGARVTAQRISPDVAIVLETTAIADVADVKDNSRVASVGCGGALSFADKSTLYPRCLVDLALETAKANGIKVQVKKSITGGNDAGHIHKSNGGVKTLALSAPTRYLHSATCVASVEDYDSIKKLVYCLLVGKQLTEVK